MAKIYNNPYILIIVTGILWGFSFIGATKLMEYVMPIQALAARWTVAGALFLIMVVTGRIKLDFHRPKVKALLLTALCQPCIYSILEIYGLKHTSVSISSIFIATIPCATLLVGMLIYRSSPGIKGILGIIIAFAGVLVCTVFLPDFSLGGDLRGYAFMTVAVLVGSLYVYTSADAGEDYEALEITAVMAFGGTITFNGINLIQGRFADTFVQCFTNGPALAAMVFLGVGCSFICYLFFNRAVVLIEPSIVGSVVPNMVTVIGIVAGVVINKDPAGMYTVIGCVLTLAGVWLTTKAVDN